MQTPVVTKRCLECQGRGRIYRMRDPWTEDSYQCPECCGNPDEIRIDSPLALAEALELEGRSEVIRAYIRAGYTEDEAIRDINEAYEDPWVRSV